MEKEFGTSAILISLNSFVSIYICLLSVTTLPFTDKCSGCSVCMCVYKVTRSPGVCVGVVYALCSRERYHMSLRWRVVGSILICSCMWLYLYRILLMQIGAFSVFT